MGADDDDGVSWVNKQIVKVKNSFSCKRKKDGVRTFLIKLIRKRDKICAKFVFILGKDVFDVRAICPMLDIRCNIVLVCYYLRHWPFRCSSSTYDAIN